MGKTGDSDFEKELKENTVPDMNQSRRFQEMVQESRQQSRAAAIDRPEGDTKGGESPMEQFRKMRENAGWAPLVEESQKGPPERGR